MKLLLTNNKKTMNKKLFLILSLACLSLTAWAQSMTDEQVVQFIKTEHEKVLLSRRLSHA